jgi:ligand-binding SRPBCC domain-containing protein
MRRVGRTHVLERSQLIRRPRREVWAFFANPANLEELTPDFLHFRILTPQPIALVAGARIDYRLSLFGLPFSWRTRIDEVVPGDSFVDVQLAGPYRRWRHTHRFDDAPGGTLVSDRVEYELPLGRLGDVGHALFVGRTLARIFEFRRARVEALFPPTLPVTAGRDAADRVAPERSDRA